MKLYLLFTFLIVYLLLENVNADFEFGSKLVGLCDTRMCGDGQVCLSGENYSNCVLINECKEIAIGQTFLKNWTENGIQYTLYRAHIYNLSKNKTIDQIAIQTDCTLNPRDNNSVWRIDYSNGFFTLPSYGQGILPNTEYWFGYINIGKISPNLYIKAINYK